MAARIQVNSIPARWICAILAACILVGAGALGLRLLHPPPLVPRPVDLEALDPQLRDYLRIEIAKVEQAPRKAASHARLGLVLAVNALWGEARTAFSNVVKLDAQEPHGWMYSGVAAQELQDLPGAVSIFKETVRRFPNFMPGYYRLGFALLTSGSASEAEPVFAKLAQEAPNEWRGHVGLGEVKLRLGRPAEAVTELNKALALDPSAKSAHALLGQAFRSLGRQEEAELHSLLGQEYISTPMPDAWSAHATEHMKLLQDQVQLANDLAAEGNHKQSVRVLAEAYAYHDRDVSVINQLAIALNRSGQPNKAGTLLEKGLGIEPLHVPSLVSLAMARRDQGRLGEALGAAEKAITLAPNLAQPYLAKANVLLALEKDVEALGVLEKAASVDPKNAELAVEMGDILWHNLRRPEEARKRYETACQLGPVSFSAHARLFEILVQFGEIRPAWTVLEKLRRINAKACEAADFERQLRNVKPQ